MDSAWRRAKLLTKAVQNCTKPDDLPGVVCRAVGGHNPSAYLLLALELKRQLTALGLSWTFCKQACGPESVGTEQLRRAEYLNRCCHGCATRLNRVLLLAVAGASMLDGGACKARAVGFEMVEITDDGGLQLSHTCPVTELMQTTARALCGSSFTILWRRCRVFFSPDGVTWFASCAEFTVASIDMPRTSGWRVVHGHPILPKLCAADVMALPFQLEDVLCLTRAQKQSHVKVWKGRTDALPDVRPLSVCVCPLLRVKWARLENLEELRRLWTIPLVSLLLNRAEQAWLKKLLTLFMTEHSHRSSHRSSACGCLKLLLRVTASAKALSRLCLRLSVRAPCQQGSDFDM